MRYYFIYSPKTKKIALLLHTKNKNMATTADVRSGLIIKVDGSLYSVIEFGQNKTARSAAKQVDEPKADNLITIKSPMIGTFYRSAGPGKPIFVNVGDEVANGKVVCIIEAMKLFNEIESEIKGKIVKVLVDDASPVEYDQPLFLVDPS